MPRINITPSKTYGNADAMYVQIQRAGLEHLRYVVAYTVDGRCYPIFVASPRDINTDIFDIARKGFCVVN